MFRYRKNSLNSQKEELHIFHSKAKVTSLYYHTDFYILNICHNETIQ